MDTQKVLKIEGTLPDVAELNSFLAMARKTDLYKHQAKKTIIKKTTNGVRITLFIKSMAGTLFENAFATGTLAHWKNYFTITDAS